MSEQLNASEINEEIEFYGKKQARMLSIFGGITLGLGAFALIIGVPLANIMSPLVIAGLVLWMGTWFRKNAIVRFGPDYLVCDVAPLGVAKTVLKNEVIKLEHKKKNYIVYYKNSEKKNKQSKVLVPITMLAEQDREACISMLKQYTAVAA